MTRQSTTLARIAVVLACALAASLIAIAASATTVQAQAPCQAGNAIEWNTCVNQVNAGSVDSIEIVSDFTMISFVAVPTFTNGLTQITVNGKGHTITGLSRPPGATGPALPIIEIDDSIVNLVGVHLKDGEIGVRITGGPNSILAFTNSTVSGNITDGLVGSGESRMFLDNATLHANGDDGIQLSGSATADVNLTTVADNAFGIFAADSASATVTDSLIARNVSRNCLGAISDGGGNIEDVTDCTPIASPAVSPTLASSLVHGNSCCPASLPLLPGSPAVDHAGTCDALTDAQGRSRGAGKCDAGAYEAADCEVFREVFDATALGFAVGCYNAGVTTRIDLRQSVSLTDLLPVLDGGSGVLFVFGNGHTIDGSSLPPGNAVWEQVSGALGIRDVVIKDSSGDGFWLRGGNLIMFDSTIVGSARFGVFAHGTSSDVVASLTGTTLISNVEAVRVAQNSGAVLRSSTIVDHNFGVVTTESGSAQLDGSVVARNGQGCSGSNISNEGGNVFEDGTCGGPAIPGLGATLDSSARGNDAPPGSPPTVALLAGSPAVDANTSCGSGGFDARGVPRNSGECDAGAFELGDGDVDGDGFQNSLGDGADCDDGDPGVFPGADEIRDDGIDQDCDGSDLTSPPPDKFCDGKLVTVDLLLGQVPTAGDDVILGTPGPDVIEAGDGDDTVCARGGDDVIVGGSGDDTMFGEGGRDIIRGNAGVDMIDGGAGNDRLLGGIDGDTLIGGEGDDYLGGFGGPDTIIGGPGSERIFGGFGADTIDGGPGDDVISGLIGNDNIEGGDGDDTLNGDRGKDTINGGNGNDTINGGNSDDILNGGAGNDSVNGGRADDQLSGGPDDDTCVGNKQNVADTADDTCELEFGIP